MAKKGNSYAYPLKLRQLPKREYFLLKAFAERLSLEDDTEVVTIALRVMYEKYHSEGGREYIKDIVNTYRSYPDEERTYEL